jgi:hypothetical protein
MASEELDFPLDDVVEGDSAVVDVVVAALAAMEFCLGARSAMASAGPTGACVSCSATMSRIGMSMSHAWRMGR